MYTFKKYNINKISFVNFLILLLPLSLILGNMVININIILICFTGILIFKNKIFFIDNKIHQILIWIFFLYIIIITFVNNVNFLNDENELYKSHLFKSLFYLRFLLLFLTVAKLIETNNFELKKFFISFAFFSLLLSIDIVVQVIFGKDLIGNPIIISKPSGFFGEENIAGGYLQKFILFFIFYLILQKKIKNNFLIFIIFLIFFIPILLTGNRMPALIYLTTILFYFVFEKKIIQILFLIVFSSIIILTFVKFPVTERSQIEITTFYKNSTEIIKNAPKLFYYNDDKNINYSLTGTYLIHFNTGIQIWKKNKLFGNGLKSFQLKCKFGESFTCNTHPHNYFIEMLVDVGIFGLLIIYILFLYALINFTKHYILSDIKERLILFPFFAITVFEFFPIRSTGSFFTTNNSLIIFLILAIFLNYKRLQFNYRK